jgi:hypothetical protein
MINELPDSRNDGDDLPAIFIPDKTRLIVPHSARRMNRRNEWRSGHTHFTGIMMPTFLTNADFVRYGKDIEKMIEADPTLANNILLYDVWDKQGFTTIYDVEITDNEWADFVDFCSYETVPWYEWYDQWLASDRGSEGRQRQRRTKHGITEDVA